MKVPGWRCHRGGGRCWRVRGVREGAGKVEREDPGEVVVGGGIRAVKEGVEGIRDGRRGDGGGGKGSEVKRKGKEEEGARILKNVLKFLHQIVIRNHPQILEQKTINKVSRSQFCLVSSSGAHPARPLSSNLPHLAALPLLLAHPAVRSPSRLAPLPGVDFACAFRSRPAWALISARNPSGLAWAPRGGLRARVVAVLGAARAAPPATRPEKLLLVLARGVGADPVRDLAEEFGAVEIDLLVEFVGETEDDKEEGWVSVSFHSNEEMRSFRAFEIDVVVGGSEVLSAPPPREVKVEEVSRDELEGRFGDFVGKMRMDSRELVNLDTTALVATVSGISNGGVGKLMGAPEAETRARFKCNYKFVMDQVQSELQSPILIELGKAVNGKECIICETVNAEFKEIISMCGGPEEKTRASQLLKQLVIVPDNPSPRMMDLPTTRKLATKNKVVFGTGDHWRAPTLTANMGFVRAVSVWYAFADH